MFVSSYSTYVPTNTSDKVAKQKVYKADDKLKAFDSALKEDTSNIDFKKSNLPVDYISKKQVLHNKQQLNIVENSSQRKTKNLTKKFDLQNSLINADSAYKSNLKMFSLLKKPHATIDQTPNIQNTLPKEPMDIKELNMRHIMVNTYIANDNYYKVTA
ncbi:MAG: hypothetical protein K8R44_08010 [Sulfurimonas sp.]|nr:hypothetical protein [Sulfurimonas sp.]